ncbi:hypothetical protein [Streptomyces mirabilis]|uniref:hypothetical protein n=1 Tax=Streptomyces mirabilis TaxID=68239 RepID=UPI00367E4720
MDACTLGDLLDVVGGPSVRLQTAPAGLAVPVTEALLYDAHAPLTRAPGALLLAVGVRASAAGARARPAPAAPPHLPHSPTPWDQVPGVWGRAATTR